MFSRSIASCIATAATTARAASSSRVSGLQKWRLTAFADVLDDTAVTMDLARERGEILAQDRAQLLRIQPFASG